VQDAVVLWVGEFPLGQQQAVGQSGDAAPTPTPMPQTGDAQQAPTKPEIITLIVSPQDAVSLNYLMLTGAKLNLVLRSAGDNQASNTEAVTLQFIMDQYNVPVPAKLPYGMEPANTGDLLYPPTSSQPATTQPQQ
jgi:pilus assembly protein CpaB